MTVLEQANQHLTKARATILLRKLSDSMAVIALTHEEALWWLMTAEQALNGERTIKLHALIARSVEPDLLAYIVTGRVQ